MKEKLAKLKHLRAQINSLKMQGEIVAKPHARFKDLITIRQASKRQCQIGNCFEVP